MMAKKARKLSTVRGYSIDEAATKIFRILTRVSKADHQQVMEEAKQLLWNRETHLNPIVAVRQN